MARDREGKTALQIARERGADNVGSRRQELAEFHVGRAEARESGREPRGRARIRWPFDDAGHAQSRARRQWQGPGIDQAKHALACEHVAGAG